MYFLFLVLSAVNVYAVPLNSIVPQNVVTVPPNCPDGQVLVNGVCRDIWRNFPSTPAPILLGENVIPMNMVTVPASCPPGQELVNGQCRDVWRSGSLTPEQKNVITVPSNCPSGQQLINGQCRDVWRNIMTPEQNNVIAVPPNCPSGQQLINGQCRDIWNLLIKSNLLEQILQAQVGTAKSRTTRQAEGESEVLITELLENDGLRNIISVPSQCPDGYRPDAFGVCRKVYQG